MRPNTQQPGAQTEVFNGAVMGSLIEIINVRKSILLVNVRKPLKFYRFESTQDLALF